MLAQRFEYLSSLFFIEDDFLEAQTIFVDLLFYMSGKIVYLHYQPIGGECTSYCTRKGYRSGVRIITPHKQFSRGNLTDFLNTCMSILCEGVNRSDMIEQVVDEVASRISAHSNAELKPVLPSTIPVLTATCSSP